MADAAQSPDRLPEPRAGEAQFPEVSRLVAEHGTLLYRYAYRLTGIAADAEDLTQQVFLTALHKLDQLRDPAAARAWLFSVLRRAYLRQVRKPRPQPAANFDVDVDLLAIDVPDDLTFDGEELQRAIDELPDDFKLVLVGFYFEDCTYKELAERLEVPIGTVMSRLSRAKGYLRTRLLDAERATVQPPHIDFQDSHNQDSHNGGRAGAGKRVQGEAR